MAPILLRGARCLDQGRLSPPRDLLVSGGLIASAAGVGGSVAEIDLQGMLVLPAFVNAHDVLDLSTLPPLGASPPYASVYEWTTAGEDEARRLDGALSVPLGDRLFLGAVRNLLSGVASVLHHHRDHRSLGRPDFPVRVQRRYAFAHSPGLTPALRRTYRTSDRRIPWVVRAAEGRDPALRQELDALAAANVLRQNTVIAHGTALEPQDALRLVEAGASLAWCPESDLRLYGRTAPAAALLAAGVAVGLGSDGAPAGGRDLLSALPIARRESGLSDTAVLDLATHGSGDVARLPVGGFEPDAPADLLVAGSLDALLAGDRRGIALVLVRGQAVYGEPVLLRAAGRPVFEIRVDGEPRALEAALGRRLASLLRRHAAVSRAAWLAGVAV